jgi:hypothetical protein
VKRHSLVPEKGKPRGLFERGRVDGTKVTDVERQLEWVSDFNRVDEQDAVTAPFCQPDRFLPEA